MADEENNPAGPAAPSLLDVLKGNSGGGVKTLSDIKEALALSAKASSFVAEPTKLANPEEVLDFAKEAASKAENPYVQTGAIKAVTEPAKKVPMAEPVVKAVEPALVAAAPAVGKAVKAAAPALDNLDAIAKAFGSDSFKDLRAMVADAAKGLVNGLVETTGETYASGAPGTEPLSETTKNKTQKQADEKKESVPGTQRTK